MRKTKFNRSRSLQIESLESRELLSVSPLNVGFESQDAALVAEAVYVDAEEAPAAPGNLNVEPGTGRNFVLNWDAAPGATSYEVCVQFGDRAQYALKTVDTTSYVTPSFPVGDVTFSVYALDADGERSIAAEETVTVIAPTNPANFSAKALPNRQVELTWDAAPGASYYQIYYQNASGNFVNLMQSKGTSCTTTRVAVGEAVFRIATVAPGITPNVATAREAATTIAEPTAPTGINAVALPSGSIELTWNAVPGANYYQAMLVGQDGTEQSLGTTADTTFTTRAFANGEYTLRLYTFSAKVQSDAAEFTVNVAAAPAAPTGLRGTAQPNRVVNLTWNAVANATAYQVYWENAAGVVQLAATVTGPSYGGRMFPSGDNTFFVRALNGDTVSEASDSVIVTNAAPATPQNLKAVQVSVPGTQRRDFDLTWNAVTGASSYQISRQIGQGNWVVVKTVSTNSCRTPSFPLEADVNLRVVAIAPGAQSAAATITVTVERQTVAPPTAPALTSTANTQDSVTLAWAAQTGLTGYSLRYKVNNTADWTAYAGTIAVTAEGVTVTGLEANTSYDFQLTATNGAGDASSNLLTVKTAADPSVTPPGSITATDIKFEQTGAGTVKVTFPPVDGATSYTVYDTDGTTVLKEGLLYGNGGIIVSGVAASNNNYSIAAKNSAGVGQKTTLALTNILTTVTPVIGVAPKQTAAGTVEFTVTATGFEANKVTEVIIRTRINGSGAYVDLPAGVSASVDMTSGKVTVTGLTTGTSYTFTAALVNIAGEGEQCSGSASVAIAAAPGAPTNVVAVKDTLLTDTVNITWTAPASAPGSYKVEYSTNNGTSWNPVTDAADTDTKATVSGLKAGVYLFRVTSFSGAAAADIASNSVFAAEAVTISATDAAPTAPVIDAELSKQSGNGKYTVVWGAVYGATSYEVAVSSDTTAPTAAGAWTSAGTATSYELSGAEVVDEHYVFVRATNSKGSTNSAEKQMSIVDVPDSAATTVVTSQKTTDSVTVTVTLEANPDPAVDAVVLYVQTGGTGTYSAVPAEQVTITGPAVGGNNNVYTAVVTGLSVGTTYRFGATAKNAAGESEQINGNLLTLANPPAAPTGLEIVQSDETMNAVITWTAVTGADDYKVSYFDGTGWTDSTVSSATTTLNNLAAGTYRLRVASVSDDTGEGAYTETTFTITGKLPAATNVKALQTAAGKVTITWNAVAGATGYEVWAKVDAGIYARVGSAISGGTVTTAEHSGLAANSVVSYYVLADNVAGLSNPPAATETASYANVTVVAAAVAPKGNVAQSAPNTVTINVTNNTGATPTNAEDYIVYMRTGSGAFVLQTQNVEVVKDADGKPTGVIKVTGLSVGTTYTFQVTAKNVINETDPSVSTLGSSTIVAELTAPTEVVAARTADQNQITVTWKAVEGAEKYNVYLSDDGGTTWGAKQTVTGNTNVTYTSGDLTYSANWVAKVAAVDTTTEGIDIEGTQSAASAAVPLVTGVDAAADILLKLKAPTILTASQSGMTVTLTWKAVPGAETYTVYNGTTGAVNTAFTAAQVAFETVDGTVTATITGGLDAGNDFFTVVANPGATAATDSILAASVASGKKELDVVIVTGAPTLNSAVQDGTKVGAAALTMDANVPANVTVNVYYRKDGSDRQTAVPAANISVGKAADGIANTAVITVTGLEPGSYQFVVSYTNAAGESNQSASDTETITVADKVTGLADTTIPASPDQGLNLNDTDQTVTLNFAGGASAAAAGTYALYYASTTLQAGSPVWTLLTGTDVTVAAGDLAKTVTFRLQTALGGTAAVGALAGEYVVIAVKKPATGAPTNALPTKVNTAYVDAVTFAKASDTFASIEGTLTNAAGQTITLNFSGGASSVAAGKTYTVYSTVDGGDTWVAHDTITAPTENATTASSSSIDLSDLTAAGTYKIAVFTTDPTNGETAVPAAGQVLDVIVKQPAPTGFNSTTKTDTTVTLGWTANATATEYSIQYKLGTSDWATTADVTTVQVSGQTAASRVITGLTANTAYNFRIAAVDANGTGAYSVAVDVTTALATPSNFAVTTESTTDDEVVLTWDAVTGATGYTVQVKSTAAEDTSYTNVTGSVDVSSCTVTATGLGANTPYTFRIQATGAAGTTASGYATVEETTKQTA